MMWAALAVLLWIGGARAQIGPDIPDMHVTFLGGVVRPGQTDGMADAPPARATAILVSGGFGYGATETVRTALDAAPHARLVAFDSPGGRPLAADGVAELIRDRHLDTFVKRYCASACIIAFAAGTLRSADAGARFAFHRASAIALDDLANVIFTRLERQWFVRGGVSMSFGNRALHAPNRQPYVPPADELLAAGFLHRISGRPPQGASKLPKADPVFEAMRWLEPQTAAVIRAAEQSRIGAGMPPARAHAIALDAAALVVGRWQSRSSDTAILALADATLAALSALDPVACMQWQVGIADQEAGFSAIPPPLRTALIEAEAAVLRDANAYPVPLPPLSFAQADAELRAAIGARSGNQALVQAATPEHAFDHPAESCAVSIAYLQGLRQRPEGAAVLRWALASG